MLSSFCSVKVEQVVEEFLNLVPQKMVKEAEELAVEGAKGRENEGTGYLMVEEKIGDEIYHIGAFYCFETVGKITESESHYREVT